MKYYILTIRMNEPTNGDQTSPERCCVCRAWAGPGINVDHSHCNDPRSDKTLSKFGDKDYDSCLYFTEKQLS